MNEWQVLRQLKKKLEDRTWPSGGAERVFGTIAVSAGPESLAFPALRMPIVLIRPGPGTHDPDARSEPGSIRLELFLRVMCQTGGDPVGEAALLGAHRADEGSSGGAGLLELQEQLYATLKLLGAEDGVVVQARSESAVQAVMLDDQAYVAYRDYGFTVETTVDRFYAPAEDLVATDQGGGDVLLTWSLPPDRYDRFRVILRRAAGSTPPATHTSGTDVALSGNLATSVTDSPGAGTFSYALFATYDERDETPDSDDQVSAAVTRTVVVT